MKTKLLIVCLMFAALVGVQNVAAQTKEETKPKVKTEVPAANPADVASIDAIVKALYDVISGGVGQKRDWNRFRSLFHKDGRLSATYKRKNGSIGFFAGNVEGYIESSSPPMEKEGFFEKELARQVDTFGNIAHVFSTYESFHKADDKAPFERGINSFQLYNDGTRWWILSILWQDETEQFPIPKKYLKN